MSLVGAREAFRVIIKYRRLGGCEVFVVNGPPRTGKLFRFRFSLSFRVVRACVRACVTCRACEAVCGRGMCLPRGGRPGGQTTTPPPRPRDFWSFLIFNGLERCPVWDAYVGVRIVHVACVRPQRLGKVPVRWCVCGV